MPTAPYFCHSTYRSQTINRAAEHLGRYQVCQQQLVDRTIRRTGHVPLDIFHEKRRLHFVFLVHYFPLVQPQRCDMQVRKPPHEEFVRACFPGYCTHSIHTCRRPLPSFAWSDSSSRSRPSLRASRSVCRSTSAPFCFLPTTKRTDQHTERAREGVQRHRHDTDMTQR